MTTAEETYEVLMKHIAEQPPAFEINCLDGGYVHVYESGRIATNIMQALGSHMIINRIPMLLAQECEAADMMARDRERTLWRKVWTWRWAYVLACLALGGLALLRHP